MAARTDYGEVETVISSGIYAEIAEPGEQIEVAPIAFEDRIATGQGPDRGSDPATRAGFKSVRNRHGGQAEEIERPDIRAACVGIGVDEVGQHREAIISRVSGKHGRK